MTTQEIKSEIQKSLDKAPEDVLKDVLGFLKQIENKTARQVRLSKNLSDILIGDKQLLERLAK
jgi:hypothetical protein